MNGHMSAKPTAGEWIAYTDPEHFGTLSTVMAGGHTAKFPHQRLIVQVGGSCSVDEQEANTRLIAEAGTVLHETGLSPRQLAEQREKFMWQVRDTCARAEKAEAQRAELVAALERAEEALRHAKLNANAILASAALDKALGGAA